MKTADMIADNPGTWMFHCHVEDHMEGGMMAVYTVYTAPTRPCPIEFVGGEFWKNPETFSLTVRNSTNKTISQLRLTSEMFLAPQDLRRPSGFEWSSNTVVAPRQQRILEKPGIPPASAKNILGWVFFPYSVKYEDGTEWHSQSEGECFKVIWRDPEHPDVPALPPRQREINAD
jgi:hypothetical protein